MIHESPQLFGNGAPTTELSYNASDGDRDGRNTRPIASRSTRPNLRFVVPNTQPYVGDPGHRVMEDAALLRAAQPKHETDASITCFHSPGRRVQEHRSRNHDQWPNSTGARASARQSSNAEEAASRQTWNLNLVLVW